jgi:hypothetical protein
MSEASLPPIPPTSPFEAYPDDRAARQQRWPVVFGILSLVVGVFGFCMQGAGLVYVGFNQSIMKTAGMEVSPPPEVVRNLGLAQAGILAALGIVLVVGSSMLLLRKPLGALLVKIWAISRLVMVVAGLIAGVMTLKQNVEWQITMTAEIRESLRKNPQIKESQLPPIPEREEAERKALWGIVLASVGFSIWPFVMAIVLTRANVRADVEAWKTPTA